MRLLRTSLAVLALAPCCGVVSGEDARPVMAISIRPDNVQAVTAGPAAATQAIEPPRAVVRLTADSIEMRRVDGAGEAGIEIVAVGNVILTRGHDRFRFRRLAYNLETEVWTFELDRRAILAIADTEHQPE